MTTSGRAKEPPGRRRAVPATTPNAVQPPDTAAADDTRGKGPLGGGLSAAPDDVQQLERTREQLGETVEQLAAKADVKGRARAKAAEVSERVKSKTSQAQNEAAARAESVRSQLAAKTAAGRQKAMSAGGAGKDQLRPHGSSGYAGVEVRAGTPAAVGRARSEHRKAAPGAAGSGCRCGHCRLPGDQVVGKAMIKLLYKPMSMLVSVLAGILAGAIFKKAWKIVAREDDAPKATDAQRGWAEVLLAAVVQGAIFAVVKAAVDRGAAEGTRKVTGVWPGDKGGQSSQAA